MASLSLLSSNYFFPHFAPIKLHYQKTFACSVKKPRGSRKGKSNAELCNDIREFLSEVGLPEDLVPSIKQLSHHGRQDLAHIVRRRGYKVIREILTASAKTTLNMSGIEEGLTEMQSSEDKLTGQNKKMKDLANDVSLSSDAPLNGKEPEITLNGSLNSNDQSCISPDASFYSSLQEKAAKFIHDGQLDTNEDTGFGIINGKNSKDSEYSESPNAQRPDNGLTSKEPRDLVVFSANGTENFIINDHREDLDDEAQNLEDQADINRLKFMLHQKELELMQLKQEIEKEKVALSALQEKAENEISKAQLLISEKDAELHAAEESLSELKEVVIEFCGDGENVEVSGSFNGWHQTIKMDLIQSSTSMESRVWRTVLWLYPGVYEIKFVVDGHWKIDPKMESTVSSCMHNNILRVER